MVISACIIVIKYFYSVCMYVYANIYTDALLYLYIITEPQNQIDVCKHIHIDTHS